MIFKKSDDEEVWTSMGDWNNLGICAVTEALRTVPINYQHVFKSFNA